MVIGDSGEVASESEIVKYAVDRDSMESLDGMVKVSWSRGV